MPATSTSTAWSTRRTTALSTTTSSSQGTRGYANGDFNYDGIIDAGDYGIIDNTFQLQGAPIPMAGGVAGASGAGLSGVTAVPEPASLSVMGIAAASLLAGRRRRRSQQ
jgi:hypothetical protein